VALVIVVMLTVIVMVTVIVALVIIVPLMVVAMIVLAVVMMIGLSVVPAPVIVRLILCRAYEVHRSIAGVILPAMLAPIPRMVRRHV
jgi:hypothetical protein